MDWTLFLPELSLLLAAMLFLARAWLPATEDRRNYGLALALAAVTVVLCLVCVHRHGDLFYNVYRVDLFSQVFKTLLALGLLLTVFLCDTGNGISPGRQGEYFLLLFTCTLAMMLLVSSVHLLTIYMALELSSYSLYVLVFLRRQGHLGMPAGLRYFLVGACASAVMLFGLALIYGATGTARLVELTHVLPSMLSQPGVALGVILTLGGFFFKLAVFPFHFWAPDAYEGAPNQVATYIATVSKVAAAAILVRVVAPTQGAGHLLSNGLVALALISMTVGNLAAIAQKDFKRLMAFSSIAHGGYILIGILSMTPAGYSAVVFYAAGVLLMKYTCFMVMVKVAPDGHNLQIAELAGLHRRAPLLAMALMLALFGLAGIPPTIGFTAKLLVFSAAMQQGYLALVVIAMLNVVISLYYYLLVLKAAYLIEPESEPPQLEVSLPTRLLSCALMVAIVAIGFYPTPLVTLARSAARVLM